MTTSAYAGLTQAETIFKTLVWDPFIAAAEAALFTYAPFLAVPPIREIITSVINFFTDKAFSALVLVVDVTAIKLVNEAHMQAYQDASIQLNIIAQDQGTDSPAYQEALANAQASLATFAHFGSLQLREYSQYPRLLRRRNAR